MNPTMMIQVAYYSIPSQKQAKFTGVTRGMILFCK